jgi:hypothetical protein
MAYPTVDRPYGLQPVNLIGGQVFAGSTRSLPIQYGYATNMFYGDFVSLNRGFITRTAISTASFTSTALPVGIFLGCSFTNPVTKQKQFSQFWPTGTLAGDAMAIVTDDPDTVFKAVAVTSGVVVASAASALVGQNVGYVDNGGNVNTGNSLNAVLVPTVTPPAGPATTSTLPLRIVGVVPDTAVTQSYTGSSTTQTITLTTPLASTAAIAVGSEVGYIASNGQYIGTGSYVNSVTNTTTVVMNNTIAVPGSVVAIPSGSTIVFTQYPEVLVKFNQAQHEYYSATAMA